MRTSRTLPWLLAATLALGACTAGDTPDTGPTATDTPSATEPATTEPADDEGTEGGVTDEPAVAATTAPADEDVPTGWAGVTIDGDQQELDTTCHSPGTPEIWGARVADDGPLVTVMYDPDQQVRSMTLWRSEDDQDDAHGIEVTDAGEALIFSASPGGTSVAMVVEQPVPDGVPVC